MYVFRPQLRQRVPMSFGGTRVSRHSSALRPASRKPVGNSDDNSGGEEVSAVQQTSSLGHSRASQVPTKLIQKGLDFGWEQSVTGPPS